MLFFPFLFFYYLLHISRLTKTSCSNNNLSEQLLPPWTVRTERPRSYRTKISATTDSQELVSASVGLSVPYPPLSLVNANTGHNRFQHNKQ